MSDGRLPHAVFATGLVATVVFLLAPLASPVQLVASAVPMGLTVALLALRVVVAPPEARRPLQVLLAGLVLYVGAWIPWYFGPVAFGTVLPFPSPLDAVFLASYACYAGFLILALRRRAHSRGLQSRLALVDTSVFTLSAATLLWVGVLAPALTEQAVTFATLVTVAYPIVLLFLFALSVRLGFSSGRVQGRVALLLFFWLGTQLAGDAVYGVQSANGTFRYAPSLVSVWLLGYSGLAALAAHAGVSSLLQRDRGDAAAGAPAVAGPTHRLRRARMVLLLLAALVPTLLAALTNDHDLGLLVAAAAVFALALYRTVLVTGDLREQRRLATELENAMRELQAQHDDLVQLAAAVDATPDAVVTCSPDGVILRWNPGAERLFGYAARETVGRHVDELLLPEQREVAAAARDAVRRDGPAEGHGTIVRKDGSPIEVEATMSAVHDEDGRVIGLVGTSRDVTGRNRMQREVAAQARRLDEAQRVAQVGSWEWDLGTDAVVQSDQMFRIFGLQPGAPMNPQIFLRLVDPDEREKVEQAVRQPDGKMVFETSIRRPDGEQRWISVRGGLTTDADGAPLRRTGTVQDVTERYRLQEELVGHVARLDEAQRLAGVGSFERDLVTGRDIWSSEYYRLLGVDPGAEASYQLYLDRLHPQDRARVQEQMRQHDPGQPLEYEARIVRPDGEVRWLAVRGQLHTDERGAPVRKTGTAHDITERKAGEAELERLALTDALTGLANRERFSALLSEALRAGTTRRTVGLLLLDLDGFKDVNDGLGHDAGDLVLQEVAWRVTEVLRGDQLARLGGDEFAVVLPDIAGPEAAVVVAARIRSALEPAFDLQGMLVHVGASIGIVLGHPGDDPRTLLKHADVAMYRAKTLTSGCAVFDADEDDLAAGRLQMVVDLRAAIEAGDLDVVYQPILDSRSRRVTSFEALARWPHPERGNIPPDQFIPLAEQADLIIPLTRLVLGRAVAACAAWRADGHDVRVGVNLAVQVLQSGDPCAVVVQALAAARLDPQHLVLEITESSLATEGEGVESVLRALRGLGVTLVIDDFGTGYSAMSYLKELPVEELKIDRSFVRDIASDPRDLAIVQSLIRLAHSLSLRVVAEGVESAAALEVLNRLGCDFAQGYGIARPMSAQAAAEWLARYDPAALAGSAAVVPNDLLVVDDSRVVRAQLRELATAQGWSVREAASAEEAVAEVERLVPDVVILDHHMTGMTGMQAVPRLRAAGLDGPILLFTQFLSEALPSLRVPLDVWPVPKNNPGAILELLDGYRASMPALATADAGAGR